MAPLTPETSCPDRPSDRAGSSGRPKRVFFPFFPLANPLMAGNGGDNFPFFPLFPDHRKRA